MLSIRMQRLGRKGHPMYRVIVQDNRQSPDSGKYVAQLGSYDPHTKQASLDKEQAAHYLKHGAQPSDRVIKLFGDEKITLPKWVNKPTKQERKIRKPEKLRRNRPAGEPAPEKPSAEEAAETEQPEAEVKSGENPKEVSEEKPAEQQPEPESQAPAEEKTEDKKPEDAKQEPEAEKTEAETPDKPEAPEENKD